MCEPKPSASLRGPLLAVGGALALALGVHVLASAAGVLVALTVAECVVVPVALFGLVRLVHYGSLRKPTRVGALAASSKPKALPVAARPALEAPRTITVTAAMIRDGRKVTR